MSYCTKQNLIDRFGVAELIQRTDRDRRGDIDDAVLMQLISDADSEINGYLGAYSLPLANVPANFVRLAGDIVRYYCYDDQMNEPVKARYDSAIAYLKMVANGTIKLAPDSRGEPIPSAMGGILISSNAPVAVENY
jgi:phage gp36-like protein